MVTTAVNRKGRERTRLWCNLKYYSGSRLDRIRGKKQNNRCSSRDSNRAPLEYMSEELPLEPNLLDVSLMTAEGR